MDLELGLKITKTREDVSSSVDFRFSKDPFGPLVLSRETDSRFIIIIHLKGFKKEGIEIEINKEGDRITIKGRKPVEEMVMIRWMAWKKEVEFRVFKKVFKIPDTVDLDKIKARFDDDDATLTITMPKRVKGISGFNIEEEEEEEEERVDFGVVSEAEHKEETEKRDVAEESIEKEESDVHSEKFETEIQKEEEFGEIMENKERESTQVLEGEEKRFSGGGLHEEEFGEKDSQVLGEEQKDEEETEDDYIGKSHQSVEQDKIMERIEEEKELVDSNKESENSSLRKPGDIEGRDSHEQTIHDEQENDQQLVQAESKSDDFGSTSFEEMEEQEPDEQQDITSESRAREKKMTDDEGDGLSKVQGIEERERRNDESKIQDMLQGEGGEEKKKIIKTEIKNGNPKEDVEARMREGFTPRTQVVGEDNIAENETKAGGLESGEVDKIHELVEKKEDKGEKAKVRRQREDRNLIKLQENEDQHSKGQKPHREQENIKELVEEKTPKAAETDKRNDSPKPVQEIEVPEVDTSGKTGDEGREGKEKQNMIKNGDAEEEIDAKMGEIFEPNIADTAMKSEDFEFDKLESDEVDKIQKLDEKKNKQEENAKAGAQSADNSLTKLQEVGEQQFQGQKRHEKQEEIKELVKEQAPEAETNIGDDNLKSVQEACEEKHKMQKLFLEETKKQPEKYKEKIMETGKKTDDAGARKVQEIIRQQDLDEPARSDKESKTRELVKSKRNDEEKEIAGTETKEQESHRPKKLREQEKIQEVAEDKTNFSKNGKVKEDKETAEKKTKFGDADDISRNVGDIEQRKSDAMKGQEEKDMIQELVLEEKVSDGSKGIITAVAEKKAENHESKQVQEIDEQQSHEEDISGKQEKLLVGEISGRGEVEDVENKKKTRETEKIIRDRRKEAAQEIEKKDSDVSGRHIKGRTMIQENEENIGIDRNEHEEEKQEEADRPEKITGTIEQELIQLEQDNVEDGEKTQEPVKEKIKDWEEEEGSEESKTKTDDDDVVRKVPGINEQELYEPTREHVSKIKELVKEKTGDHEKQQEKEIAEPEIEAEGGSLRKVDGIEELDLHKPKIHKERDKTQITGAEEPSGQKEEKVVESMTIVGGENYSEEQELHEPKVHKERDKTRITEAVEPSGEEKEKIVEPMTITLNVNSVDVQEIKKERPDKPESHEKQYKIQEVVEAEHNNRKEEKVMDKAKLENKEESLKKVQEVEKQGHDQLKRSMIQGKIQETEEKNRTRAMEENEIVERTKTKEASLRKVRDDENSELRKPSKRQKGDKIQELVELGTSDYREKAKKQDEEDILKSQVDLGEFEKHGEQRNIPQLIGKDKVENVADLGEPMEDDNSGKFHESKEGQSYEDWTQEGREKRKDLVKEEANDPKDEHTGGESHNDHKEEKQEEKVIAKAELNTEEDSSKKGQEIEKQENDGLKRSMVQDKMEETEKKDRTRAMDENEIVERRPKTKDGSLKKIQEGEDPELSKQKRHGKEDMIQELVEAEINDHRGKVKKKDGDDILRSQETGKLDLGERERRSKQRKIHQSAEDKKGEGIMENISEPGGKMKGDSSDKFHKQKSYKDWKHEESEENKNLVKDEETDRRDKHTKGEGEHEEERYEKIAGIKTKVGNEINKKVGEDKEEQESDKQERYGKLDKAEGVLREGTSDRENLVDDFTTKIQETEKEKLHELEMHEKQARVPGIVEDDTGDQEDEEVEEAAAVVASNENGSSRKVQKIEEEEEREESEKQKEQNTIPETSDPDVKEEDEERVAEKETKEEAPNKRSIRETKEVEAHHVHELERKTENCRDDDGEGRRGENGKQGKTVETMSHESFTSKSDDSIMRKAPETKVQEPNEKKNQEGKGKIEELKRKESSNHEVKLAAEDESLRKGQDFLEKESTVSKRRPVEQEKIQEVKEVEKRDQVNEDEEKAKAETKFNDGKSRKFEMSKSLELDEQKKILKPLEEKSNASKKPKEGNVKIAEEEMQDMIDSRVNEQDIRGQEPYELLKHGVHDKIPEYHREKEKGMKPREIKEMKRTADDVSSRKVQQIKDELEKHQKPTEIPEKHNIQESEEKTTQEHGEEEMNEGEQNKKAKRILQVESKANDGSSENNRSEGLGSIGLREQSDDKEAKEENRAGAVWREGETQIRDDGFGRKSEEPDKKKSFVVKDTSGKAKENMNLETKRRDDSSGNKTQENKKQESHEQKRHEEEVVGKAEAIDEYDSSGKIHEHEERMPDEMRKKIAEEGTSDDKEGKEGNRAGAVLGEVQTKTGKVREIEEQEQDKKQSLESGKAKEKKNQETQSRDDSSRKTTENQESHEQKRNDEQEKKNLGLVEKKTNCYRNEEDGKEDKEIAEAEVSRKLKGIDKKESTKMVERHANQDNIQELVEEKLNNQEGEDKKSMITEVLKKAEDGESIGPEALRKQDKSKEQRLRDNPKDEETAKTETQSKDNESREINQIKEKDTSKQERLKEQGRIKELVEDRTLFCRKQENGETEFGDGSSKTIQELGKEESNEPGRDEKGDRIQEPVDRETSEDDEEELEIEFEDEEEDWEAEVIQERDSDEDNDKIRRIKRIRLGFRLVGGSTLFMSLIVIVISFIRSKRKIRCYKF